jgi:2-phosphoglycerate kinase
MIYLIGGPPRVGKTILAESLARKKSIPYFSLDHVTSVIVPYLPAQEHSAQLPLRIARLDTNFSNDDFYARYSTEEIVGFYLRQAETCWPGIESFIKYAIQDDHDLILEGWQILPRLLRMMITNDNQDKMKAMYLYKINVEAIAVGFKTNTSKSDWVMRNTRDEGTYQAIAKMISHFGQYIEAEGRQYGFHAVNTESGFNEKIGLSLNEL